MLEEAQRIWPERITWTYSGTYNNHWYQNSGNVIDSLLTNKYGQSTNFACGGFAAMLSDYLFGQTATPFHRVYNPMDIRAGDVIVMKNPDGTVRNIEKGGVVRWPDYQYSVPWSEFLDQQFVPSFTWEVWSRYPE